MRRSFHFVSLRSPPELDVDRQTDRQTDRTHVTGAKAVRKGLLQGSTLTLSARLQHCNLTSPLGFSLSLSLFSLGGKRREEDREGEKH